MNQKEVIFILRALVKNALGQQDHKTLKEAAELLPDAEEVDEESESEHK